MAKFSFWNLIGWGGRKVISAYEKAVVKKYEQQCGCRIRYIQQGTGGLTICGDLKKFSIHATSHLKSGTFIECSGGVTIGRYFHTGRSLTIFSTNHNYCSEKSIPYDEVNLRKPVTIEDFVWIGANVTLAPGTVIGEGAIISTGSVVFGTVPPCAIVRGNPAQVIRYRNREIFEQLKAKGKFY